MQITPSQSVLQALGSTLSQPEPVRQLPEALAPEAITPVRENEASGLAADPRPDGGDKAPGARVDLRV